VGVFVLFDTGRRVVDGLDWWSGGNVAPLRQKVKGSCVFAALLERGVGGYRGCHTCLGSVHGNAVVLGHESFRLAGELRGGDFGISLADQLFLACTGVT